MTQVRCLLHGSIYLVPPYRWYSILCNPHLFPPLSSVMSAFVQTLPVPPVPGDLPRPDTTCSNGKINRFSFTSEHFCKRYSHTLFPRLPWGMVPVCSIVLLRRNWPQEGLRNKVGTEPLSGPVGWLSYISPGWMLLSSAQSALFLTESCYLHSPPPCLPAS